MQSKSLAELAMYCNHADESNASDWTFLTRVEMISLGPALACTIYDYMQLKQAVCDGNLQHDRL